MWDQPTFANFLAKWRLETGGDYQLDIIFVIFAEVHLSDLSLQTHRDPPRPSGQDQAGAGGGDGGGDGDGGVFSLS